jgi:hypothetical protein
MLTTALTALALFRFGLGRGGGSLFMLVLLAIVGVVVWQLLRSSKDAA